MMIRRATVDDAARLAELGAKTFRETFGAQNRAKDMDAYVSQTYGEELQRAEILDATRVTLVVEEGSSLIAFAQLRMLLPELEIARFYVDSGWHGTGVALSLMGVIVALARELHASRLWLGVWERNARAMAFYGKCGFRACGWQRFLLGSDVQTDRVMELCLNEDRGVLLAGRFGG